MRTLKKRQTRGEAIIRRHDGSLKVETVKAGVLRSDTELCGTDKAQVVVSSGLRTLIHMGLEAVGKAATRAIVGSIPTDSTNEAAYTLLALGV